MELSDEQKQIRSRLLAVPPMLRPLMVLAAKALETGFNQVEHGPLLLGPRPDLGPQGYDFRIYPGCSEFILEKPFGMKVPIPSTYLTILRFMNGCHARDLSLFGLESGSGPGGSPLSLERANDPAGGWIGRWGKFATPHLFIGSRNVGDDDQIGYFMSTAGQVEARLRSTRKRVNLFKDFREFIESELASGQPVAPIEVAPRPKQPKPLPPPDVDSQPGWVQRLWAKCPSLAQVAIRLRMPAVRIQLKRVDDNALPVGVSKMGGLPDLPHDAPWPCWDKSQGGAPLALLGQLNLAEVQRVHGLPELPESGLLSFFYDTERMPSGLTPEDRTGWRTMYCPDTSHLKRRSAPHASHVTLPSCAVQYQQVNTLPHLYHAAFESTDAGAEESSEYFDLAIDGLTGHQLLGNPVPIQDSPEAETVQALAGCYEGEDFDRNLWERAKDQVQDWRLLLQLDSDSTLDVMWGDMGSLYFMIRKSDLAAKNFADVWVVMQCS